MAKTNATDMAALVEINTSDTADLMVETNASDDASLGFDCGRIFDAQNCTNYKAVGLCGWQRCAWCQATKTCHADKSVFNACPSPCCASKSRTSSCEARTASQVNESTCPLLKVQLERNASNAPVYNRSLAMRLVSYAAAAYCHPYRLFKWNCTPHCFHITGTDEVWVVRRFASNLVSYVAWDKQLEKIVVSFRGTQMFSIDNWFRTNLNFPQTHPYEDLPDVAVHQGFWEGFQEMKTEIVLAIEKKMREHPGTSILLTGHSLGGAFTSIAAFELAREKFPIEEVVNFGCPRVGNVEFVIQLHKLVPRYWRITSRSDPVPHVPPLLFMGFYHSPGEVYYRQKGGFREVWTEGVAESPLGSREYEGKFQDPKDHMTYMGVDTSSEQKCKNADSSYTQGRAIPTMISQQIAARLMPIPYMD